MSDPQDVNISAGRALHESGLAVSGPPAIARWRVEPAEHEMRQHRVRAELARRELHGLVLFHPVRIAYLTGFYHLGTERPVALVIPAEGDIGILVPKLEQEHVAEATGIGRIYVYPEYPTGGGKHPLLVLADLIVDLGLNDTGRKLGADNAGYLDVMGYRGPDLTTLLDPRVAIEDARDLVDDLRAIKSEAELGFIRASCLWGNYAHRLMQEKLEVGRNQLAIQFEASVEATVAMSSALGPGYQPLTLQWGFPCFATFNAGANTALPHGLPSAAGLRRGDVLVTFAGADVGGYNSELERTMLLGEPTPDFERSFGQMLLLQEIALAALRPGRSFAEVEAEVVRGFADLGVADCQRHHTGHGIGLEGHEFPFIDLGEETVIAEGMVLSVEPGLYVPGLAGFRHSDTVVITTHGSERLTYYPRDLESLVVPA